jgi:hypothetical protein
LPNPTEITHELQRVGVRNDAANLTKTEELVAAIDKSEDAYMDQMWESCYLFAELYRRREWTVGLNARPRNAHFAQYVQQHFPRRGYTENELMTRVDCYITYSRFGDPDIVTKIKEFGGLTKPHMAIPWVQMHRGSPEKVKAILELCQQTPAMNLRAALRARFPIRAGSLPQRKIKTRGNGVSGEGVIQYLATRQSLGVIEDELFVPRQTATEMEIEYAYYSITQSYILDIDGKATVDDVFFQMMQAWIDSLDPTTRANLLRAAHHRWLTTAVEMKGADADKWPFSTPDEQMAAAE